MILKLILEVFALIALVSFGFLVIGIVIPVGYTVGYTVGNIVADKVESFLCSL